MQSPREYLKSYLERFAKEPGGSGVPEFAARTGIPYSTLAAIMNGYRGISAQMADRMHKADPLIDRNQIVWVRQTREDKPKAKAA